MLSNTADTKPRPSAVCHDASGRCSTGIIEAIVTRDNKNIAPLKASGSNDHSGLRTGADTRIATHTAAPSTGNWSSTAG